MSKFNFILLLITILLLTNVEASEKKSRISIGAGVYNFMKNGYSVCKNLVAGCDVSSGGSLPTEYKDNSFGYNLEYFPSMRFMKIIKPFIGFLGTNEETYYSYMGLSTDLYFWGCKCLIISPSLAAGWYIDGNEIKMGHNVEFRSGGDIAYRFKNNVRIGVGIFHLSNSGLGSNNPGSEQAIFKYQIPF